MFPVLVEGGAAVGGALGYQLHRPDRPHEVEGAGCAAGGPGAGVRPRPPLAVEAVVLQGDVPHRRPYLQVTAMAGVSL